MIAVDLITSVVIRKGLAISKKPTTLKNYKLRPHTPKIYVIYYQKYII